MRELKLWSIPRYIALDDTSLLLSSPIRECFALFAIIDTSKIPFRAVSFRHYCLSRSSSSSTPPSFTALRHATLPLLPLHRHKQLIERSTSPRHCPLLSHTMSLTSQAPFTPLPIRHLNGTLRFNIECCCRWSRYSWVHDRTAFDFLVVLLLRDSGGSGAGGRR